MDGLLLLDCFEDHWCHQFTYLGEIVDLYTHTYIYIYTLFNPSKGCPKFGDPPKFHGIAGFVDCVDKSKFRTFEPETELLP